jgi:predicted lipoprotein with Yx(FWY)xxD motif
MTKHPRGQRKRGVQIAIVVVLVSLVVSLAALHHSTPTKRKYTLVVKIYKTARFGDILVTAGGATLYTYKLDTENQSNCTNFCLHVWPPLFVPDGRSPVGEGVSGLGAISRSDGQSQVTYDGMPLYTYALDHGPGQINGNLGWWSIVQVGKPTSGAPLNR